MSVACEFLNPPTRRDATLTSLVVGKRGREIPRRPAKFDGAFLAGVFFADLAFALVFVPAAAFFGDFFSLGVTLLLFFGWSSWAARVTAAAISSLVFPPARVGGARPGGDRLRYPTSIGTRPFGTLRCRTWNLFRMCPLSLWGRRFVAMSAQRLPPTAGTARRIATSSSSVHRCTFMAVGARAGRMPAICLARRVAEARAPRFADRPSETLPCSSVSTPLAL